MGQCAHVAALFEESAQSYSVREAAGGAVATAATAATADGGGSRDTFHAFVLLGACAFALGATLIFWSTSVLDSPFQWVL